MSQGPPQPAGASASQLADAIAQTASPTAGGAAGIPANSDAYGTVVSFQPGSPFPTVTVTIGGATTPTAGVRYVVGYSPNAGDNVILSRVGSDVYVSGVLSGAAGSGGGPVPVGAMLPFPANLTDPAWLLCNGASFSAATYPALSTFLGGTTLPDMRDQLPMGAHTTVSLGANAGAATANALIAHTHSGGSHTHAGGAHTHSHSHGASAGDFAAYSSTDTGASGTGFKSVGGLLAATDTDATSGSATTGAGSATTGSAGSGSSFSILNPVLGVAWFIRAL